jgi:hypothetical protein
MESNVLFLILGWLLGILSPLIVERVRKQYQTNEVKQGIITELKETRSRLAAKVYLLASRLGRYDRNLLIWISNALQEYEGSEPKEELIQAIQNQLKLTDQQLSALAQTVKFKPGGGLSLKSYSLPFLNANLNLLSLFPIDFQTGILEIRAQIDLLNQEIEECRFFYGKTFDSGLSEENYHVIVDNTRAKYQLIESAARRIADSIKNLVSKG